MKIPSESAAVVGRKFIPIAEDVAAAILRTLQAGWVYALESPDVDAAAGEVAITECLRDGMRQALKVNGFPWRKKMVVLPGTESRSQLQVLRPDGRTDIPILVIDIFRRFHEHDPHAIVECKRIAGTDTGLCRNYVIEGIHRFQIGKYAGNHKMGFMAGYILCGDAAAAAAGINRYLSRKSRNAEHLKLSGLIPEDWAWNSCHPRAGQVPGIQLHHTFFEIHSAPP